MVKMIYIIKNKKNLSSIEELTFEHVNCPFGKKGEKNNTQQKIRNKYGAKDTTLLFINFSLMRNTEKAEIMVYKMSNIFPNKLNFFLKEYITRMRSIEKYIMVSIIIKF